MRPLPQWVLAVSVYRKSDLAFFITGFSQCRDRLVKCLSRVMGNYHARFLGDGVAAMPLCYPTKSSILIPPHLVAGALLDVLLTHNRKLTILIPLKMKFYHIKG